MEPRLEREIRPERFRKLLDAIRKGDGVSLGDIAEAADVSFAVLGTKYLDRGIMKQSTMADIAEAIADAHDLPWEQLSFWLVGEAEPSISQFVEDHPHMRRCLGCKRWFDMRTKPGEEPTFLPRRGRCTGCTKKLDRLIKSGEPMPESGQRLPKRADSPTQQRVRAKLRRKLPDIHVGDPDLAAAVVAALDEPIAVTVPRIAQHIKPDLATLPPGPERDRLLRSIATRLRRFGVVLAMLRVLGSSDASAIRPTKQLVRREAERARKRRHGLSSTASAPPAAARRRRRKGAEPRAGGGYFSTEAVAHG